MLHVFVSSTWLDLQPERTVVENALNRIRETRFVGMEYFGSREETTREVSLAEVDRSDLYLGIFGERYGSGITEDEYRRAQDLKLPCFIYFKDKAVIPPKDREQDPAKAARLAALKVDLKKAHTQAPEFSNADRLATLVSTDLHRWIVDKYLTPRLEQAAQAALPPHEAQALIHNIKDWSDFRPDLLAQLRSAGFAVASGSRSVAIGGNVSGSVITTGDANITTRNTYGTASGGASRAQLLSDLAPLLDDLRATLSTASLDPKIARASFNDLDAVDQEAQDAQPNKAILAAKLRSIEALAHNAVGGNPRGIADLIRNAINLVRQLPD